MNPLRALQNSDLLDATFRLAVEERRITLAVLEHFREIERRKAYADLGFKSLFDYAVAHLRYSEGSASRRISAMRALKEHPELAEKIETGEATVTAIARIQTTIRRDEKRTESRWPSSEKKELFRELGGLGLKALERELVERMPEAALTERTRPVAPGLHEVTLHLTSEDLAFLEELRGSLAHGLRNPGSNSELVQKLIRQGMEALERARKGPAGPRSVSAETGNPGEPNDESSRRSASPLAGESPASEIQPVKAPALHSKMKRTLFARAGHRCEHLDPNGKRCDSRFFLQIEHRKPRALGGTNDFANLEVLCRDHNLIRGIRTFGPEKMRRD